MVLSLLYPREAVRLVVAIEKELFRRTEERTENVVPSFFFLPVGLNRKGKSPSFYLSTRLLAACRRHAKLELMIVDFVHIMSFLQHCNK